MCIVIHLNLYLRFVSRVLTFHGKQNCLAGNHKNIFNDARVPWSEYRYYDPKTVGLDFDGMIADIKVPSWLSYARFSFIS